MKKIIQKTIEKMVEMKWITINENLTPDALYLAIGVALKEIKVIDFLEGLIED